MSHLRQVAPSDSEESQSLAVSVQATLSVFEFLPLQAPRKQRFILIFAAAFVNFCIYLEGLVVMPLFLTLPSSLNTETTLLILSSLFFLYCGFINSVYLVLGSTGKISSFLRGIDNVVASCAELPALAKALRTQMARYRRMFRRLLFIALFIAVGNGLTSALQVITSPDDPPYKFYVRIATVGSMSRTDPLPPVSSAPWSLISWQVVIALFWVFETFLWVFGFFILFALGLLLTYLLSGFCSGLSSQVSESAGLSSEDAAAYRLYYTKIIEIVNQLDSMLRHYIFVLMVFLMTSVMFCLNALLEFGSMSLLAAIVLLFWFVTGIVLLCLLVFISGRVYNLTKKPLELLHKQKIASNNFNEIIVFLHAVSNSESGLTCANFFILDYSLLVSLAGLFLSYFILIIQTRQAATSSSELSAVCNCSKSFS